MSTPRPLIQGRLEGVPAPLPATTLQPSAANPVLPTVPSSFTADQMFTVISRLDNSLAEIARAVKPLGTLPRPDPDPPYSHPLSSALAFSAFQPGATWSTTTSIPPLGHHPPPPHSTGYGPSTTAFGTHSAPSQGIPYQPPNPNPMQHVSWSSPVTSNYGPPVTTPSSWDIPSTHPPRNPPQDHRASCWDHPDSRLQPTTAPQDPRRIMKMDPPRFDGTDTTNWISRVQYYFDHIQLPIDHRLHYVIMLFDPPAAEWVFNYRANNTHIQWQDFLEDVRRRFDPLYFQDFTGLIAKLTQTGSLTDYNTTFESMLSRVRNMPESTRLSVYIEGLQQPVRTQVRHQHPVSVAAAMALAVEFAGVPIQPPSPAPFPRRS